MLLTVDCEPEAPTRYQNHCWFNMFAPSIVQLFMPVELDGSSVTEELPSVKVSTCALVLYTGSERAAATTNKTTFPLLSLIPAVGFISWFKRLYSEFCRVP